MNNETQPTPEQLTKRREEFFKSLGIDVDPSQRSLEVFCKVQEFEGYLRAKQENEQETEQAMKLAKFGAITLHSEILMFHSVETIADAISCGLLVDDAHHGDTIHGISYAPNIETTIKELLK